MKNITIFILFALFYFATSDAGMYKLYYTLPEESQNWIESIYVSDNIILVAHQTGISVSINGGESFKEAQFDKAFRNQYKFYSDAGYISNNKSIFLISSCNNSFISTDSGISFKEISNPPYGFAKVIEDKKNFYCRTNYYYTERMHIPYYFVSRDKGMTWHDTKVGSNDSENVHTIYLKNNILYVMTDDSWPHDDQHEKLYRSIDNGDTYEKIAYQPDTDIVNQTARNAELFLQRWNQLNLDMPPVSNIERFPGYLHIKYHNENMNAAKPMPGIFYERPSGGAISANLTPRLGGFTNVAHDKIYYASFKDIWVEQ